MKTVILCVLFVIGCVSCSKSDNRADVVATRTLSVPGVPKFDYPSHYSITPESGKGEARWTFYLHGQQNEPEIEASGFVHIPDSERKDGESSLSTLRRLYEVNSKSVSKVNTLLDGRILNLRFVHNEEVEVVLWYAPSEDANGSAIKALRVKYRSEHEAMVEKLIRSWIEGVKLSELENK